MAIPHMVDRVGQVLGGRYRLIAPIGTGASASVYLGDDVVLRRRVAIKVLHAALADDEAFLRRFRAEAQAAAALNHPNVMAVYDWGQDRDVPYLVTEFLGGGSLRALLDTGTRLSLSQALLVGLETARGLEYAHRRGFVHRDIKPANLLLDEDARLRIADFGLARALAEAAWTEPMGAVLGTAKYASPEQARGEVLDGRSDVYSLALVVVESVTGTVPFGADTTLGTLMARVDRVLEVPEVLGPLRTALEMAGVPDPAQRPDAGRFGAMLLAAAEHLDRPAPLPLAGVRSLDAAGLVSADPTVVSGVSPGASAAGVASAEVVAGAAGAATAAAGRGRWSRRRSGGDDAVLDLTGPVPDRVVDPSGELEVPAWVLPAAATAGEDTLVLAGEPELSVSTPPDGVGSSSMAGSAAGFLGADAGPMSGTGGGPATATATTAAVAGIDGGTTGAGAGSDGSGSVLVSPRKAAKQARGEARAAKQRARASARAATPPRRGRRVLVLVVVLAVVVGVAAAGWWFVLRTPTWGVPALVGQPAEAALSVAVEHDWQLDVAEQYADGTTAGQVLGQDPPQGTALAEGGLLRVTVSLGPTPVAIPADLAGLPVAEATARLQAVGLEVGETTRRFDEDAAKDVVLSLGDGVPAELPKGSTVPLVVSDGPEPRTIPSGLAGVSGEDAVARLEALGLVAVTDGYGQFSDQVPQGQSMGTDPGPGTQVPKGAEVIVIVSKGPQTVVVANVAGESVVDAAAALEAQGLVVSDTKGSPRLSVVRTDPAAGTEVRIGTSVTIVTGSASGGGGADSAD